MDEASVLNKAKSLLRVEAAAVNRCADRIDSSFARALDLIESAHAGGRKLVLSGVGKSHYVAAKLSASFMSTGLTAIFLHPVEAFHGDLGAIQPGDVALLFSKSGGTPELLTLLSFVKGRNPVIAVTGNLDSPIAKLADVVLDASVEKEACPNNMLPTASTTVALAIGDALVSVSAEKRGFTREIFAGFHPGGSIGKRLNMKIADVLTPLDKIAFGGAEFDLRAVARAMSERPMGAFCVVDDDKKILGIITEGDIRRAVSRGDPSSTKASALMNPKPLLLTSDLIIEDAIALLEQPKRRVSSAPVVTATGELIGLVQLHDLI